MALVTQLNMQFTDKMSIKMILFIAVGMLARMFALYICPTRRIKAAKANHAGKVKCLQQVRTNHDDSDTILQQTKVLPSKAQEMQVICSSSRRTENVTRGKLFPGVGLVE